MSIKKKVSIQLAVQDAMENMGLFDDKFRPVFTRWAEEAEEKIGSFTAYKRKYVNTQMEDLHHAPINCSIVSIIGIMCGCIDNNDEMNVKFRNMYNYYQGYNMNVFTAGNFLLTPIGGPSAFNNPMWEIQGNKIVFLNPQQEKNLTLDCLVRETDKDGFILINDNHRDAITAYIEYMRACRSRWLTVDQKFSPVEIREFERVWFRKLSHARAEDAEPTASEMAEIVSMYNDPLSGSSMAVWRYADEFYRRVIG